MVAYFLAVIITTGIAALANLYYVVTEENAGANGFAMVFCAIVCIWHAMLLKREIDGS